MNDTESAESQVITPVRPLTTLDGGQLGVLMDNIPIGVLLIDAETHVIADLNARAEELIGCEREKIIGNEYDEFICSAKHGQCPITDMDREMENAEKLLITHNGETVPILNTVKKIELDGRSYIMDSFVDLRVYKTVQIALRESEERFKKLSNLTFEGILLHDMGLVLDVNESFLEMFGYSIEEIIGKKVLELLVPEEHHEIIREKIIKRDANPYEVMGRRKDGTVFPLELEARNVESGGKIIRVVALRDITERKKTEETLRASEEKYRLIAETSTDLIAKYDLDGNYIYASPSHESLGYDVGELIGTSGFDMVHPEDAEMILRELENGLDNPSENITKTLDIRVINSEGEYRDIESTANFILDGKGEPESILLISKEVTEKKEMERALKESEKKFRTMMRNSADAVFIADRKGNYTYVNPAAEKMLGYDLEEFMNMNIADILRKEDVEKGINGFQQLLEKGKLFMGLELVRKDGGTVPTELNAVVMDNGDIYGSCRDIAERKKMEGKLKANLQNLERYKKATVEREHRMIELKEELRTLKNGSSEANNGD